MSSDGILGTLEFAIGGIFVVLAFGFSYLTFRSITLDLNWLILGMAFAFLGFALIGMGIHSIIKDAKKDT